jgi:aminoglycoside phosphotransferase family enzyme/predicted kinase
MTPRSAGDRGGGEAGSRTAQLVHSLARQLGAELVETHISWVLLGPQLAYKIKKPVRLSFVDYSTLQARRHFCEEELRLNTRLAPSLYLGVASINGTADAPVLGGQGPALEYAVRMRRFAPGALFSEQLAANRLLPAAIDATASLLGQFHLRAPAAPAASGFASTGRRYCAARAALRACRTAMSDDEHSRLLAWMRAQARTLGPMWERRRIEGKVRECHGDLHLANLVCVDGRVAAFDGVEFSAALRWIDVIDDIAFAVMDFCAMHRVDYAFRLLNAWLDWTGDHEALPALRFSVVYRALVRSQVALLRADPGKARRYVETAISWLQPAGEPSLVITHGLPGSGKTYQSQRLLERGGAIRIRSDVERKRLAGLQMLEDSRARGLDLYSATATAQTYARALDLARIPILAGYAAIVDAAFLRRAERDDARRLAAELGVPLRILACDARPSVLAQRLQARTGDASEADVGVLERLRGAVQPLGFDEEPQRVVID